MRSGSLKLFAQDVERYPEISSETTIDAVSSADDMCIEQ